MKKKGLQKQEVLYKSDERKDIQQWNLSYKRKSLTKKISELV